MRWVQKLGKDTTSERRTSRRDVADSWLPKHWSGDAAAAGHQGDGPKGHDTEETSGWWRGGRRRRRQSGNACGDAQWNGGGATRERWGRGRGTTGVGARRVERRHKVRERQATTEGKRSSRLGSLKLAIPVSHQVWPTGVRAPCVVGLRHTS
jgi:hypothetical protein